MASTSKDTYLLDGGVASSAASFSTPLVAIKDYSDLDGTPNMVDITTLSDAVAQQIPGVKSAGAWEFTCNYDKTEYTALKLLEGVEHHYAVWFGSTGTLGKISCTGILSIGITGAGVDAPREMKITIARSSDPVLA